MVNGQDGPSLRHMLDSPSRLHASRPDPLPFAPSLHIRAFVLEREPGNLLIYAAPTVGDGRAGDRGARRRHAAVPQPLARGRLRR